MSASLSGMYAFSLTRHWSMDGESYSPGGANVHAHLTHGSLDPRESTFHIQNDISIGSADRDATLLHL